MSFSFVYLSYSQTYNISFFIKKAQENSPLLHRQNNQNKIIKLDLNRIRAIYTKPQITADANLLLSPIISTDNNKTSFLPIADNATNYYGYDLGVSDGGQYQAIVSLNKPLFNAGKIFVFKKHYDIQNQLNSNNIKLTINELNYSVKYQYLLCFVAKNQLEFEIENKNLLSQEINIMKKLVDNGVYNKSDLTLLQIEQKNYAVQSINLKSQYDQNIKALFILCGVEDTSSVTQLQKLNLKLNLDSVNNIFTEKYRLDSLTILSNLKIHDLQYKPQLSAFADAGLNAVYKPNFNRLGYSFGLKFSWLLYDGKQRNIFKQRNEILLDNNFFEKKNFTTKNDMRKQSILNRINSINKQINIRKEQLIDYDNLLKIYKLQVSQGQLSIINFVEVLKKYSDNKKEKLLLEMQKQILINTYNYWNN